MSKAANILALSEASCSDTFSLHSLYQMVSLSTVFFRPVIYCNVLIDVYLFVAVSHPKSVSDEQPGRIVSQAPASDRKLHLSAFVCFTSFSFFFFFFILRRTIFPSTRTVNYPLEIVSVWHHPNAHVGSCSFGGLSEIPGCSYRLKNQRSDNSTFCQNRSKA